MDKEKLLRERYPKIQSTEDLDPIEAYVIFETIQIRDKAYDAFQKANKKTCCCFGDYPDKFKYKEAEIKLNGTEDPSNIVWENLEVGALSKCLRTTLVYLIMALLILVCMSAIYALQVYQASLPNTKKQYCNEFSSQTREEAIES